MRRCLPVRALSMVVAATVTAGACGAVFVSASGEAAADTPTYTTSCANTPLGPLSSSVITTGKLPSSVKVKKAFTLTASGLQLTIKNRRLLSLAAGFTVGGKVETALAAKGALPAMQPVTYNIKPTTIPSPAPTSLTLTAKGSTTTFNAPKAGKVSVRTTGSTQMSVRLLGSTFGPYRCTSSPASLQIAKTVAAG